MDTVYPDDDEIKFRKDNYGAIEDILNDKVECTICNNDLLNEIISKKMIMVHKSHLFLCCYNCFYKLCEGNEYNCVLCNSNRELSNCEKCNINVCNRCIENHKLERVSNSNGVLKKCFCCEPQILWKQRAQSANLLKIFSSQLDMPNGLLVNEVDREKCVWKYLIKESKVGQNSTIHNIQSHMRFKFVLNAYKLNIITKLSEFCPTIEDNIPIGEQLDKFIQINEQILVKSCLNLTDLKRIFNLNWQLKPGVSAIMKSFLKSVDDDDNELNASKVHGNLTENNENNQLQFAYNGKSSRSQNENNVVGNTLSNSQTTISSVKNIDDLQNSIKQPIVVLEQLDKSILSKLNNKLSNVDTNIKTSELMHPLNLLNDSISNSSDDEEECTRKLRSCKVINTNKKNKNQVGRSTRSKKLLDDKSDDEKENDRLISLDNLIKHSKTKALTIEDENDTDDPIDENLNLEINKHISPPTSSNKEVDQIELMNETIQNLDENDLSTDDNISQDEKCYSTSAAIDIFNKVRNNLGISQINPNDSSENDSDDSSIFEVINDCMITCNKRGIDHYRNKSQENQIYDNNMDTTTQESSENEKNEKSDLSNTDHSTFIVTRSKQLSLLRIPSVSDDDDDDSDFKIDSKLNGKKRKLVSSDSSNNSDSSSKYFKKTPKKKQNTDNSDSSSTSKQSDTSSPVPKQKRKRRIKNMSSDDSSKISDDGKNDSDASTIIHSSPKKGRKNIRKLKKQKELSQLTQNALKEEESRKQRIENRQKLYNKMCELPKPIESCTKLVLDFDPETMEELVTVHPDLVKFLKPHQVEGIKFLWNSVFESLAQIKKTKGSGSILAHCMGLGKTLQIVSLIHTLFRYPETGIKTVLVITPNSTIENWCNEFYKWMNDIPEENKFFVINFAESKTYRSRKLMIDEWQRKHGVLITSYELFRTITNVKIINKNPSIFKGLVDPGPDLVICDEGHILKNHATAVSKAVNKIKTLRRIVLTGTPLQNNLKEYHCMVDFIRPNLLGSIKDFTNRFINPITNGQYSNSTPFDVKLMKRRSHVLHRMLGGFVQRFDYSVLTPFLPPKHEYVIYLKLSDIQIKLYRHYLDNYRQQELFTNYHMLQMIWTHPKLLSLYAKRTETKKEKQKYKNIELAFVDDSNTSEPSNSNDESDNENIPVPVIESTRAKSPEMDLNWWKSIVPKKDMETVHPYSKFIMMFSILKECEEIGDKVLLFSQSLFTLDLIQDFLENTEDMSDDEGGPFGRSWTQGQDFFRIDGSVALKTREDCCRQFNDDKNTKMRLLLLSTKAFNLGINLVGANRVIIFDVTWNPTLNVQSIFRVFRFGQNKPCYIYRLVSEGTMEQKIYERQISKLSMAFRVVDEHQIDRHFNAQDQEVLYEFEPNTTKPKTTLNLPKDRLMAELILKHKDLVMDILEHDSLLQNNEAEELNESDRNAAWEDYQKEKDGLINTVQGIPMNIQMNHQFMNPSINNFNMQHPLRTSPQDIQLFNSLKGLFPQANILQLNDMLTQVKLVQNVEQ